MSPSAHRAASPSDDGRSSNASRAPSNGDTYYSNEDIAALHAVVTAAQELLDSAPEPKPLPAAALFKAYDAVLPTYGIDPDTDHHLSTFVFRVGGERGDGSLLDKFQTILNRMGIVLEFGDNTTASSRTSPSASPAFSSTSRQSQASARQKNGNLMSEETDLPRQPSLPSSSPEPEHRQGDEMDLDFSDSDEEDGAYEEMRKTVLSSAMNRWRSLIANRRTQQAQRMPSIPSIPEEASVEVRNFENRPFQSRPAVMASEPPVSTQVNGIGSGSPLSKELSSHTPPVSPPSSRDQSPEAPVGPVRPPTAHAQHGEDEDMASHHENEPRFDEEEPTSRPENPQEEPSHHSTIRSVPAVHIPQTSTQQQSATDNEQPSHQPSTPPDGTRSTTFHEQPIQQFEGAPTTPIQQINPEREHQRLLRRAARAREIYLASKVFNHWADRTARRLERDAVARRHMIRFRYFRSWSQAPALREPTVDHMRAAVAVKKWQRTAGQENGLEETARAAARAYEVKKIQRVLDHWSCHRLEHVGRQITASRSRTKAVSRWMTQASNGEALNEAIKAQAELRHQVNAIHQWQGHDEIESARADAARRIGNVHQSFTHLGEWWDQAEIGRRATMYRQRLLMEKANFAFDQWNLQARAQAFIWRREYLQVTRVFDRWCQRVEQDQDMGRRAEGYYEDQAKSKVVGCFRRFETESSQITHLENRARLYLGSTMLLRVFDRAVKHRKDQDKRYVKRYLMARYTQVSSARKKRNFFSALDRWTNLAAEDRVQRERALELQAQVNNNQRGHAIETWAEEAATDQMRLQGAKLQHAQGWLAAWKDHTDDLEQRDAEAWQLWAADKQRHSLKSWSIASLQQSGQAHTALAVRKKHARERRNRVLQQWKQRDDRLRTAPGFGSQPNSAARPSVWSRGSWRGLPARRSTVNRSDRGYDYSNTPLETPTRWTGQAFSMSTILPPGSMAPLREADELDAASSFAGDDDDVESVASPSLRPASRGPGQFSSLSSTTPMAPVPSHLGRDVGEQPKESGPNGISRSTRPGSRIPRFESPLPSPPEIPRQTKMTDSTNFDRHGPPPRPLAATRSFGFRQTNRRTIGPRPTSPELKSQAAASKSVGSRPSGLRFGAGQTARITPSTRSVRIQSPTGSFLATTPLPAEAPRRQFARSNQQRGRINPNQ
ncbi:hypothetical protein FZEAL_5960 [Fusarium zealandicum]|uniref:Sfi1 spindle body domain-containing protein n=1 Tax=Fusarium zealandicum TaxID=1053134 RepID=A0A8H4UJM3_9HYPO|nr:hypothetical protein FZEAL_5960 [Fusarium zealandicum]